MAIMNNAAERIRRELLVRVIKGEFEGTLADEIDRIPIEMRPSDKPASRCCIYKDRAVLKYRLMAMLGHGIEDEADESRQLKDYLKDAQERSTPPERPISVIPIACYGCIDSHYLVTNACHACFARPCTFTCPKQAISINGRQAEIDHTKCIDCGKCANVCPYKAIIRVPIPCEEACPTGAIRTDKNGHKVIDFDRCISCGKCVKACPFCSVVERSQLVDVIKAIKSGKRVVGMLAPAFAGQFPGTLRQLNAGMLKLGFHKVMEVAAGAEKTTEHEAHEFVERMQRGDHLMTTSCCPAYVEAARKIVPEILPFVSDTPSPMGFSGRMVKGEDPECISVFIGPCVAKRQEALNDPNTDYVMTFDELAAMFEAMEIDLDQLEEVELDYEPDPFARGYANGCGVTAAILHESGADTGESPVTVNGKSIISLDKKTMRFFKLYAEGKLPGNFLEVMACEGGCVGGPCSVVEWAKGCAAVKKLQETAQTSS